MAADPVDRLARRAPEMRDGMEGVMAVVSVIYSFVDGAHFFTSDEPKWGGLLAASTDFGVAWDDVAVQLKTIAKLEYGVESEFEPQSSPEEFLRSLLAEVKAELRRREQSVPVRPARAQWAPGHHGDAPRAGRLKRQKPPPLPVSKSGGCLN